MFGQSEKGHNFFGDIGVVIITVEQFSADTGSGCRHRRVRMSIAGRAQTDLFHHEIYFRRSYEIA